PRHNPADRLGAPAAPRPATIERARILASRRKSSDTLGSSTPPAAHSSAASPSHNSWHRLDPNQPARPRHSNPHSTCRAALRSLKRGFLLWRLSDAGPAVRGITFMGPASETLVWGLSESSRAYRCC